MSSLVDISKTKEGQSVEQHFKEKMEGQEDQTIDHAH